MSAPSATLDLDALSTIEEQSYRQGYREGEEHGKLHGTFEGRQLGLEKGFALWQELGQMEAVARVWLQSLTRSSDGDTRKRHKVAQQLESLLALIDDMPMDNRESVDIGAAMERIRAKYKLASLSFSGGSAGEASGAASQDPQRARVTIKGRQVDANQLHF